MEETGQGELCEELLPVIYETTILPMRRCNDSKVDMVANSAVNFYEGNLTQKEVNDFLKKAIKVRKKEKLFGGSEISFYDVQDPAVFAYRRGTIHVIANFSERPANFKIDAWAKESKDLLTGKTYENYFSQSLGPYEVRWLSEDLQRS